jgi:ubiquinol-cytochrome c reductase cytochrome c subunit
MRLARRFQLLAGKLALALLLQLAGARLATAEADGEQLYQSKGCYQCHGYVAQGGSARPRLRPIPLPAFMLIVRKPPNVMPAYSPQVLTDGELQAIYEFVAALR